MHISSILLACTALKDTRSAFWEDLADKGFVVQKNLTNFTVIGIEYAQERISKNPKKEMGEITTNHSCLIIPETLLKYCLSTTELSRLSAETEEIIYYAEALLGSHALSPGPE